MFEWTDDRISFMRDAAEHTGYYEALADKIAPLLPAGASVVDAGCGLGYLTLALAAQGHAVTGVDISAKALDVLKANATGNDLVSAIEADAFLLSPAEKWDAAVFCFFGTELIDVLKTAKRLSRGLCIIVGRTHTERRFASGTASVPMIDAASKLKAMGIPFRSINVELDMGQPFRSLNAAKRFFQSYGNDTVLQRLCCLKRQEDPSFPWFYPATRPIEILAVDVREISD